MNQPSPRVEQIEQRLRDALEPEQLTIVDHSASHAGHVGAGSGGHFRVEIVSERFAGLTRIAQHRLVYEALEGMFEVEIHALELRTVSPAPSN